MNHFISVYNVIYNSDFACYIDVLIKLFGYSGFQDWCDLKTIPHLPNPTQIPFSTNMTDCVVYLNYLGHVLVHVHCMLIKT